MEVGVSTRPGKHPATYRDRWIIDKLRELRHKAEDPFRIPPPDYATLRSIDESIAYHQRRCAEFEAGENRAKAEYISRWAADR